jgi:hypothetical protein
MQANFRPHHVTTGDITAVTASEDQPGGVHAVVCYISAMASRHGLAMESSIYDEYTAFALL